MQLKRTNASHPDFIALVQRLDQELAERDGEDHVFYHQFNGLQEIQQAVIAYQNQRPIAIGAFKSFNSRRAEVKRMYTLPEFRGKGVASALLEELESWAAKLNYKALILETGKKQPEAIQLYRKWGYRPIPNFGPYAEVENSLCFSKALTC